MNFFSVTVVIPNYNGLDYLKKLLDSIFAQTLAFDEIIIVDDASTDQSVLFIKNNYPSVTIIKNESNLGFVKSVNRGFMCAKSRYICLLNNDIYLANTWLEKAMEPFNSKNNIGAVATNILIANTSSIIDSQGDDYYITGSALKHNNLQKSVPENTEIVRTFSACGAAAVYDSDILKEVGLFDEFFDSYYEDVDLAFRINLYGYKILYTPYAISYHFVSATYGKKPKKMLFNSYRNEEIVFWSNMPVQLLWRYSLLRIVFLFMQSIVKLFKMQIIVYMKAKIAFLLAIPYVLQKRKNIQKLRHSNIKHITECLRKDWLSKFVFSKFR